MRNQEKNQEEKKLKVGSGVEKDSLITIQGEHSCQLFSINKSPQLLGKSVIIECAVVSWTSAASAQIFWACCQWRVSPLLTQPLATPRRWVARRQEWGQLRSTRRPRSSSTAPSVPGGCTVVVLFLDPKKFSVDCGLYGVIALELGLNYYRKSRKRGSVETSKI